MARIINSSFRYVSTVYYGPRCASSRYLRVKVSSVEFLKEDEEKEKELRPTL
jgi:hypothetical protein